MRLSKPQLEVLRAILKGNTTPQSVAIAIQKDVSQVYRHIKQLKEKDILKQQKELSIVNHTHLAQLAQILNSNPQIIPILADSGIDILTAIKDYAKSVKEITDKLNIKKSTVFDTLNQARKLNMIAKSSTKYKVNSAIWPELKSFLNNLEKFEQTIDNRIPIHSTIIDKTKEYVLFTNKNEINATKTGFSAFDMFRITIFPKEHTYILPKQKLTKQDIFAHAVKYTKKNLTIQNIILLSLAYKKEKVMFPEDFRYMKENIDNILKGQHISEYPSKEEIQDKAKDYDINI